MATAAQLAAQKLFAKRSKAGTLKKTTRTKNQIKPPAKKKAAVRDRVVSIYSYGVRITKHGRVLKIAQFRFFEEAKEYAVFYANKHQVPVKISED